MVTKRVIPVVLCGLGIWVWVITMSMPRAPSSGTGAASHPDDDVLRRDARSDTALAPQRQRALAQRVPPRQALSAPALFMVLNLERRPDRWSCVRREFEREGLQVTRVVATDAKQVFQPSTRAAFVAGLDVLSAEQKRHYATAPDLGIFKGHLATFVTHLQAIRAIAALPELEPENESWQGRVGCIFEDDIFLAKDFNAAFSGLMGDLQREPGGWDILLLNMYCTGPKFCVANDGLPPTRSPRLRRVKAFMSGAGYCLHRNSAALILASLPCQESSSSCTTAIDSYMSTLAMYGRLRAYRATTLPVAIPQDQDKKNLDNMRHPDCFSRFDSDIALWWAPPDPRRSNVCIVNRAATLGAAVRVGGQQGASPGSGPGSVVSVGAAASVHFWATEDEALEVFHDSPGGVGTHGKHDKRGKRGKRDRQHPAAALLRHRVRNEKSTLVIFDRFALLTTDDVWRGASVVFFNFDHSPMLTVTWLPAGTELRVGPGETKEVFVPHLRQAIRAGHGSSGNEGSRRVQLDGSCDAAASMRVLAEGGRGAAPSSCIGFEVLQGRDLKTDDLGSVDARSADACCNACTRRKGSCAGWTFKVRS